MGLPNCSRVRRWSVTASTHQRMAPTAAHAVSATARHRARTGSIPASSESGSATYPSKCTTPTSTVLSVLSSASSRTPGPAGSTTNQRTSSSVSVAVSPAAATRSMSAAHTPGAGVAVPVIIQPVSTGRAVTRRESGSSTDAGSPWASRVNTALFDSVSSASWASAPAMTVDTSGPGSIAVTAASSTQAQSSSVPPCPPTSSGR